ncbi:hypothetical protein L4F91_07365 [Avibacterium sp. 20-126]|uniref:hypothetical protein n=1 Tax=Avibacterium sp. 20-126 TaxID=2911524 RepID=UPI002188BB03|nr:hypothetical protein L4F91_07365 [Avibacterium sp. 20-126]
MTTKNRLYKILTSLCFCFAYITCFAETTNQETIEKQYIDINELTAKHAYQFTPQDIAIVKKLIWSSLNVLSQKSSIAEEISKLGKPFEGGEILPKKFFSPIRDGGIFNYHTFEKRREGNKEIFVEGIYSSQIRKRFNEKYWDFALIRLGVDDYGQATQFLDRDFKEFNLTFKEKFFFLDLSSRDQVKYAGNTEEYIGKDKCYAIYRFERVIGKEEYHFYFCVNRENYDEHAPYPNKWGNLAIIRVDDPAPDKSRYKVVPYKPTTLPNWGK